MSYAPQQLILAIGWKGMNAGEVYLERLVISPFVGTDSLEAGTVSRLRVLNRHVSCSALQHSGVGVGRCRI